ncbi:MAG: tetratricopeptide repeat protein [Mariniblastus sp.]|nr:tetratricopeptide repeat protein [Mariniblastus sp.]
MPRNFYWPQVALVFCLAAYLVGLQSGRLAAQSDPAVLPVDSQLEQFLQSRGLDRLLLREVEMQLAREFNPTQQVALGQRLARLYQAALLSNDWNDHDPRLLQRVEQWVKANPAMPNDGLALAIQHARYLAAEKKFREWWYLGRDPVQHDAVVDDLMSCYGDIARLSAKLEDDFRRAQILPESTQVEMAGKNRILVTAENRISHCQYLLGWNTYFLGIMESKNSSVWLLKSENSFRRILQLPLDGPLPDVTKQKVDLQSTWQLRSLLGLAMGLRARGSNDASSLYFKFLSNVSSETPTGKLLHVWNLESMVLSRQWDSAMEFVDEVASHKLDLRQQQLFWNSVLKASRAVRRSAPGIADSMMYRGMLGLVRNQESVLLQQWMDEQPGELAVNEFLRLWIEGYLALAKAEATGGSLALADKTLLQALESADDSVLDEDLARCRYLTALIDFRAGQLAEAAIAFSSVAETLLETAPEMAAESAWMNVRALTALGMLDNRKTGEAMAAMDRLVSMFPEGPYARAIPFLKLRLTCNWLPPQQAIEKLETIQESHPNFQEARLERVRNHYRHWKERFQADDRTARDALSKLQLVDQQFRDDPQIDSNQKLRSVLWVIDAMLEMELLDATSQGLLELATDLAATPGVNSERVNQLAYYRMMFARQNRDRQTAIELARELVNQSRGTAFERSALIYLAENYGTASELDRDQLSSAMTDFTRLSELLGDDARSLVKSKNSRITLFRLSEFCLQAGQLERADQYLDRLIDVFPNQKDYLAASARIKTRRGELKDALPRWRLLANGVEPGSDLWYEAKYQLARCLWSTGDANAKQVFRQTIQLSPSIPDAWSKEYKLLAHQMELDE